MNEHEFERVFRAWSRVEASDPASPALRTRVLGVPHQASTQHGPLPRIDTGRFQSMFSATKFVVAGVIVALFGGFLLTGLLTQPRDEQPPVVGASASASAQAGPTADATAAVEASPVASEQADRTTRSDIVPGVDLVTEEVEPGVLRVVSDGVRELSAPANRDEGKVVVAPDGNVWVFGTDGFYRLGDGRGAQRTRHRRR